MTERRRLTNKICLITGAARGIGRAIAAAFCAEGADVVVTDIDVIGCERTAAELGACFIALDVREEAQWNALAQAVPQLDVLVNNAGITGFESGAAASEG